MQSYQTSTHSTDKSFVVTAIEAVEQRMLVTLSWAVTTTWFLLLLMIFLVGTSLLASLFTDAWHWFQRSGALMVSIGAVISTRRALGFILDSMINDGRQKIMTPLNGVPQQNDMGELRTCVCGFMLVAIGTIIWAYGDLLGCLLDWSRSCLIQ
jgi:hypothetical protein